jgi:hypothetical protein
MRLQSQRGQFFSRTSQVVLGGAACALLACTSSPGTLQQSGLKPGEEGRMPAPPTRATPAEVKQIETEIAAAKQARSERVDLGSLLLRISRTPNQVERQALVHEYLHGVADLSPEQRPEALLKLGQVLGPTRQPR